MTKFCILKYFLQLLLLVAVSSALAFDCIHRDYGHGSTVCVCNSSYCDNLAPISKTRNGVIISYQTSASGDRFARKEIHFTKETTSNSINSSLSIDRSKRYQRIIGFGGAFTDSTGLNIAKLPKDLQHRLIRDYFGDDGIEYTLARVPIGGTDFSPRPYSYDDHPKDETLATFALQPEDLDYKIPFIQMAQDASPHEIKLFASPWSPPAWMKTNNKLNNGGFLIGEPGGKYYQLFARYFVKFLNEYARHNVSMWGITIENEPEAGFLETYKWNSLGINQTQERDFIRLDLGPELHAAGYTKDKLKIMIHDGQMPLIKAFAETILSDAETAKYVSGIAFHWYWNMFGNWQDLDDVSREYPEQFLLASEACEEHANLEHHVSLGNWSTFNRYAVDIIKDLNHYTTGWTDWNMVLDPEGGPTWANNFVDAPIIVNETSHEYYKQPFFYALGHFSKFLAPDSLRIAHTAKNIEDDSILMTVFERPDNGTVLIVLNLNKHPIQFQVNDPANGQFDVNVKAEAMNTFIWY